MIAYTLNDGVRTTVGPGANAALFGATFGTDAAGVPVTYQIVGQRTPGPPYTTNTPADPNSRLTYVRVFSTQSSVTGNAICANRAPGVLAGPGFCSLGYTDVGSSEGSSTAASTVTVTAAPAAVPSLSEWAMILFALILAGGASLHLQRRRLAV